MEAQVWHESAQGMMAVPMLLSVILSTWECTLSGLGTSGFRRRVRALNGAERSPRTKTEANK